MSTLINSMMLNVTIALAMAIAIWSLARIPAIRMRPALRHALCVTVLLKLVTPPLLEVPILPTWLDARSLFSKETLVQRHSDLLRPAQTATTTPLSDAQPGSEGNNAMPAQAHPDAVDLGPTAKKTPIPEKDTISQSSPPLNWMWLAIAVNGCGTVVTLVISWRQMGSLRRAMQCSVASDRRLTGIAVKAASILGLKKAPQVSVVEGNLSPLLWVRNTGPVVVIPRKLTDQLSDEQLGCVISHEIAHYLRRDHWTNALSLVVSAIYWWNPLVWWVRHELRTAQEACCDAMVINGSPSLRKTYAQTLFQAIEFLQAAQSRLPVLASGFGGKSSTHQRFEMIANSRVKHHFSWWCYPVLTAALLALPLVPAIATAQKPRIQEQANPNEALPASSQEGSSPAELLAKLAREFASQGYDPTTDNKPTQEIKKPAAKPGFGDPETKERVITGTVVGPDGKPVEAELYLVWQKAKPKPLGKTKANGTFKVTVPMTHGEWGGWLVAKADGYGMDFVDHGMTHSPRTITPTLDVTLKLPKERPIKGRILDQEGKPVAGAAVAAQSVSAYDSEASADAHMKRWGSERFYQGVPPDGDRGMRYSKEFPEPSATTDKDGRFTLGGFGAGQLVDLKLAGPHVAGRQVVTLNRDGFDAEQTNKLTQNDGFKEFSGRWVLFGPDPTIVLEPEKILRGRVTDAAGKPRAGVTVAFTRPNKQDLTYWVEATTDKDGKYEIRGAKKHAGYMVEVDADPAAGLLHCQGFADDTVGYEPIVIDIKQAKGVVITGRVTNKATGKAVPAQMRAEVLANNAFVDKYPPFLFAASTVNAKFLTDGEGRFRIVTIPGPVLLMASPWKGDLSDYKPPVIDPNHKERFIHENGSLAYYGIGSGRRPVQGNWCKVIETQATDTELSVNVEFDPSTRTLVKVVGTDGKPLTGSHAAGTTHRDFAWPVESTTDTHTIFNLEPNAKRLMAVTHTKKKLVGTAVLTADAKDPVVRLGAGSTVVGRVVGTDGKPLAGLSVRLWFSRRAVQEAFKLLAVDQSPSIDANGEFRIDHLFPGEEFKLTFYQGRTAAADYDQAIKHAALKHGATLDLGDIKIEPGKDE